VTKGHLTYYAITDNLERCNYYVRRATEILFKWLPQEPAQGIHLGKLQAGVSLGGVA